MTMWGYISRKRCYNRISIQMLELSPFAWTRGPVEFQLFTALAFLVAIFAFYNILWAIGTAVISVGHGHRIG